MLTGREKKHRFVERDRSWLSGQQTISMVTAASVVVERAFLERFWSATLNGAVIEFTIQIAANPASSTFRNVLTLLFMCRDTFIGSTGILGFLHKADFERGV